MATATDIFWRPIIGSGYEHLRLVKDDHKITVDSLVIGKDRRGCNFSCTISNYS
ncbi:putative glycolipid-binding domain-containing protein [Brevibacillus halotolerans]|uniref:putative glycolipid-binding domain-containing protein n=1 Tax=Brevibacillus TaxID=55080 RepID=UPI00215D18E2|nr:MULTISPECIES: putative glycolipid-binding domain-containing protein [Brevibacillus]MCR8962489.1 putative glycolipid-binding domain-containing protein [Brevibacillus laterosporus]MCZ0834644.1 putative glycolipid-binding domain-containing protein [Brevibacillus halotolerans]